MIVTAPSPLLALSALALDPAEALVRGGYAADVWQARIVRLLGRRRRPGERPRRAAVCTCRQAGKSLAVAGAGAARLVLDPGCLVAVVSATETQAVEVARHVRRLLSGVLVDAGDVRAESQQRIELANGSRLLTMPASSSSVRGWATSLLVVDEAGYVDDSVFDALLPTVAATGGDLLVASTPVAPSGRFYDLWREAETSDGWLSARVTAADCDRLPPDEIAAMRRRLSPTRARRDLDAEFTEPAGSLIAAEALAAAFDDNEAGEW